MTKILIGVAGWDYPDWNGIVYPAAGTVDRVAWIARFVDGVEINATFYRPNRPATAESWVRRTRSRTRFRFTAKAHRSWTHGTGDPWFDRCLDGLRPIREAGRLQAVLAQFPQSFHRSEESWRRLDRLAAGAAGWPLVAEFRHRSWAGKQTHDRCRNLGLGWCVADQPRAGGSTLPPDPVVTGETAYLRMHGRNEADWFRRSAGRDQRYDYLYSEEEIRALASLAETLADNARQVVVIQNNHFRGKALANALQFRHALTGERVEAPAELVSAYPALSGICRSVPDRLF